MNIRRILTTAVIIGAGLMGTVTLTHGIRSAHAQDGSGEGRWSHGHRRHGGGLMRLCQGDLDANLNQITERLTTELELSSEQQQHLDAIAQTIKTSDLPASCANLEETPPANALEKLDRMESHLETGLSTVKQIRPSFETFYTSLSSEQQADLDERMAQRRHRR